MDLWLSGPSRSRDLAPLDSLMSSIKIVFRFSGQAWRRSIP